MEPRWMDWLHTNASKEIYEEAVSDIHWSTQWRDERIEELMESLISIHALTEKDLREPSKVHRIEDGRGWRDVYLDGEKVKGCIFADEDKGIVIAHKQPLELNEHGDWATVERRGDVTVEFVPFYKQDSK